MSDDYQVRKDIDRIYRDVYSLDDDKINVVKFKDDEDDKSDLKQYETIDKIFEVYGLGDVSARTDEKLNSIDLFNLVYPVGSIYMSVNDADPSMLFGGTWERLKDRFLLGSGDTYTNGDTDGEATHTLTIDEMPSHNHSRSTAPQIYSERDTSASEIISPASGSAKRVTKNTNSAGGGQAHNNMPPYLVVNIWKRTA